MKHNTPSLFFCQETFVFYYVRASFSTTLFQSLFNIELRESGGLETQALRHTPNVDCFSIQFTLSFVERRIIFHSIQLKFSNDDLYLRVGLSPPPNQTRSPLGSSLSRWLASHLVGLLQPPVFRHFPLSTFDSHHQPSCRLSFSLWCRSHHFFIPTPRCITVQLYNPLPRCHPFLGLLRTCFRGSSFWHSCLFIEGTLHFFDYQPRVWHY